MAFVNGVEDNQNFTLYNNKLKANSIFDYETKATYNIKIRTTDQGGLFYEKDFVIYINDINETTAIDEVSNNNSKIYPNPATDKITIELDKKSIVSITNTMGVVLYSANLQVGKNEVDISNLPPGIYFVKIGNKVKKFIKE